ncbi:MAG: hypothetical protein RL071_1011 [Pseudomonadota bacterium]
MLSPPLLAPTVAGRATRPSALSRFAAELIGINAAQDEAEVADRAFAAAQSLIGGEDIILCEIAANADGGPSRRAVLSSGGSYAGLAGLCTACDGRNPLAQAIRGAMIDGGLPVVDGLRAHALPVDGEHSLALAWVDAGAPPAEAEAGLALLLDQVRAAHERLRRAGRPSRALAAAGLAHDVANLLQVVHAGADELAERCAADLEAVSLCGEVAQAATRAERLLHELRALGRPRSDTPPAALAPAVLAACGDATLLMGCRRLLRPAALPAAMLPLTETALERAVLNLLKNAILAVPEGGSIAVEVSVVDCVQPCPLPGQPDLAPGRWVALAVKDDGPGVGAALLARLGAPFLTTRADAGGSGLGLAVTRGLAAAVGGALSVDSVEGLGFAATLWLPAVGPQSRPNAEVWAVDFPAGAVGLPAGARALSIGAALAEALRPGGERPGLILVDGAAPPAEAARIGALCPGAAVVRIDPAPAAHRARRIAAALESLALDRAEPA